MSRMFRGMIIGLFTDRGSGVPVLEIQDEMKGKTLIPCAGSATARALDAAFGGVIVGGRFNNDGIAGERIYYSLDEQGNFEGFTPVEEAPPEMVEKYEKAREEEKVSEGPPSTQEATCRKGGSAVIGYLPPDHPVYTMGQVIYGRRRLKPQKG